MLRPWTVAVADTAHVDNPSIAYVTNATDRADAVTRVHAHHRRVYGWSSERILTVAAEPGVPPVDAWYGWTDLRGVKALRLVIEPDQVRHLVQLRLRLRRWTAMLDPHFAALLADGTPTPDEVMDRYWDEAEAICEAIDVILREQVDA